jgi:hypothetical protein
MFYAAYIAIGYALAFFAIAYHNNSCLLCHIDLLRPEVGLTIMALVMAGVEERRN